MNPNQRALAQAATRFQLAENIQAGGPAGGGLKPRRRFGRRMDVGRPRDRLYPQRGLAARQAHGLAPIPYVTGNVLDDDDGTE